MKNYKRYLRSEEWAERRRRSLWLAHSRCQFDGCTTESGLQVHHLNYDHVGEESDDDLVVLCDFHHMVAEIAKSECSFCLEPIFEDENDALSFLISRGCSSLRDARLCVPRACGRC